ncbi:MAG: pyridoxal phosphate-dependent aminotransferase [Burkholderiaceae bacterium]
MAIPTPTDAAAGAADARTAGPPQARAAIRALGASRIREVANAGLGVDGVLAFWFGEPDQVTPAFIRDAAKAALDAGDTFYRHNLGIAPLREALADYVARLHRPVGAQRVAVTSSGVSALMLAAQLLLGPGDRVAIVVPVWPNVAEIPKVLGARVDRVALRLDGESGRWRLDLDRLLDAITPATRAVVVNSPNNPTGWVMDAAQMAALLGHCRRTGTWIVSDEAYERLVFDGSGLAPSILDVADADDRVIVANTLSKAWQMTGWRLGWLVVPPTLVDDLGKLIEYNTSCAPGFVQAAGVVAVRDGEPVTRAFVEALGRRRDALLEALAPIPGVTVGRPDGAMYAFLRVDGCDDSLALAKALVRERGLGLAPGSAFGDEGEGWLRWCFAKPEEELREGASRLARHLAQRRPRLR